MTAQALKEAAQRLQSDETLQAAFSMARNACLEKLAVHRADDTKGIIGLQAEIAAIQRIRDSLQELVLAAAREPQPRR